MTERIHLILKAKNITASKFADEIGVQRSGISHILSGRNKPSLDVVQKIIKRFPDISTEWLISGKGPMSNFDSNELFDELSLQEFDNSELSSKQIDLFERESLKNNQNTFKNTINSASHHFEDDVKNIEKNNKVENNDNNNKSDSKVTKLEDEPQNQYITKKNIIEKESENFSSLIQDGKKIDKIVIFYTDKTFSWYNPTE